MAEPKELVASFIADYFAWNSRAQQLCDEEIGNTGEAMDEAERLYEETIIAVYCRPGFRGEPIAFGTESSHQPGKDVIISEETTDTRSVVNTQHTGDFDFVSDYQFVFTKTDGKWYLEAVDYVDGDEKYPSL